jgi:MoxR-like ATPase
LEEVRNLFHRVVDAARRAVVGHEAALKLILITVLAGRHALILDRPGVGKTTLARALARALGCRVRRIQFTPDLLPADILGTPVYDPGSGSFRYRPGPIMTEILLADEINRASPRTQSALLEAMEEGQVTVDGETHPLPQPFVVLATQNPLEQEGTFPLPESQLDRFAVRVSLGYPAAEDERRILALHAGRRPVEEIEPVTGPAELLALRHRFAEVHVSEAVTDYVIRLVQATRQHPRIELGASPRAGLILYELARVRAAVHGRDYVLPDDVKALAVPVLAHRLILRDEVRWEGGEAEAEVRALLEHLPAPVDRASASPRTGG